MAVRALVVADEEAPLAVPVHAVRAVVADPELTPVPTAPPVVLGLANVRGDIITVLDAAALLDKPSQRRAPFVVIVDTAVGPAGLAVTAMPVSLEVADDDPRLIDVDAIVGAGP